MTDKKQPEALRLDELLTADEWPGHMTLVSYARECVAELRRLHAENTTLQQGYAAARLEIESLKAQLVEHADELAVAYMCGASREKELAAQQPGTAAWMPLPDTLPEPGRPVLLDIGKKYPIRAMWAAKHTVEARDDDTEWAEYDEATDTYYCPEGWYEWNEHEEVHWRVTSTPVAWRELPPSSAKGVAL